MADSRIGALHYEIGARIDPFERALASAQRQATITGASISHSLQFAAAGFATVGIGAGLRSSILAASDLGETMSKVNVIFGKGASTIVDEAARMNTAFGTNRNEFINSAANFGAVFKGLGQSQEQAAKMGVALSRLATDMASFDNTSVEDAMASISSALRGESNPIEKYRVFLTAARVEAEAMRLGLRKVGSEFTQLSKATATVSLIQKATADAQGDLARTADSTSNQMRQAQGRIEEIATTIGQALLPAVNTVLTAFNTMAPSVQENVKATADWFKWLAEKGVLGFSLLQDTMAIFGVHAYKFFSDLWTLFYDVGVNIVNWGSWLGGNLFNIFKDLGDIITRWILATASNLKNFGSSLYEFLQNPGGGFNFQGISALDGFKSSLTELPALSHTARVNVDADLDAIHKRMAERVMPNPAEAPAIGQNPLSNYAMGITGGAAAMNQALKNLSGGAIAGGLVGFMPENLAIENGAIVGTLKLEVTRGASELARKIQDAIYGGSGGNSQVAIQKDILKATDIQTGILKKLADKPAVGAVLN